MVNNHLGIMLPQEFHRVYINYLSNDLSSNCKFFADDTSIFSLVNNIHTSGTTLSQDLNGITIWAFQWKMIFNPDLSK